MNPLARLANLIGGWRRRRSTRTLVILSVVVVGAVAATGVALAGGLRGSSPRPLASASSASAGAGASATPIDFQTITPSPTPSDTPSPSPTPTGAGGGGGAVAPSSQNTLTVDNLMSKGIDADAGVQYCFPGLVGRLTVTQPGHDYQTSFGVQPGGAGTAFQQVPVTLTATGPLTYDISITACVTWTKPETAGLIYGIDQMPGPTPQANTEIPLRVDAPGTPENGLRYVSESQSTLQEKAGVDSGFFSITANFSDLITEGDQDDYSYTADCGDGSGTLPGSGKATVQGDNIQALQGFDHTWQQPGTYKLTITLTDSDGGTAVATVTVTVS